MKGKRVNLSIKMIITLVFILAMSISVSGTGYLIFSRWLSAARQIEESISREINDSISNRIHSFMRLPDQINEANQNILDNGILDLSNEELREKHFASLLDSQDAEIYSISFGAATGEYYGARRNEKGITEIMRNNSATGGNSWYCSVNEDLTAGDLAVQAGQFDPRSRDWYGAALEADGPTYSSVYRHFIMDDLALSASRPLHDPAGELQGVLVTTLLLSGIGEYLEDIVRDHGGYAIIVEKNTGALIANSMGMDNFTILQNGDLERCKICEIEDSGIKEACAYYRANEGASFSYKMGREKLYGNVREIQLEALDWTVISAIPQGPHTANVMGSIRLTIFLFALAILLSLFAYYIVTVRLLKPMEHLLQVSAALSAGDLSSRVTVARKDEIGVISESLNLVADKMQYLINNLEATVEERTGELKEVNAALEANRDQLQMILDSTAEGIYGIDRSGTCTFCNSSCLKLLGYARQDELVGKNMHELIHHSHRDGSAFPVEECKDLAAMRQGRGFAASDEVYWRADGTYFDVEYRSYPQFMEGRVVGAVTTFMDITDRKKREERIRHLSCHDPLTDLKNRRCFEEMVDQVDIPENLPLSIIFADINGLKMTNDIFGHAAGDELIKNSAEILVRSCRENDVIARVGGDEFIILLPKTNRKNAEKILSRIRAGFDSLQACVAAVRCSISLGSDTKTGAEQSLEEARINAENAMYSDKIMNRESVNKDIISSIVERLHSKSPEEKEHALAVSRLCRKMGAALKLTPREMNTLQRAGYLHDVGKITLDKGILSKEKPAREEVEKLRQHVAAGYRILSLFDDTVDLAEYVYSHHERWDGRGYPRGLEGEQIPLLSRIIAIAETYDRVMNRGEGPAAERKRDALRVIGEGGGNQFDPHLARLFIRLMEEGE